MVYIHTNTYIYAYEKENLAPGFPTKNNIEFETSSNATIDFKYCYRAV